MRHYRGVADLAAAAEAASSGSRTELTAAAEGFPRETVGFDAWIDGQGRLRKVRHRFTIGGPSEGRAGGGAAAARAPAVISTTTLYGFGVPVEVRLPRQADIYTGTIATPPHPPEGRAQAAEQQGNNG